VKFHVASRTRVERVEGERAGLSLVELMVSIVLLAVGLLGMAALSVKVSTQQRGAASQQLAAMIVQSRFDSLASIRCQALAPSGPQSGTVTTRGITERWSVTDGNDVKVITDTVTFATRTRPLAYISVIPCRD
jgi:prepilin-type N-terminal cleavage/methylation domain-containing protein